MDYIRAEHKLHPICRLFISQVIIPQVMFFFFFSLFIFRGHSTREPASSRLTYFILRAYTGTSVSQSQHRKKSGDVLEKNADEWAGRVEISEEEITGSKRSTYGCILTTSGYKGRTFKLCVLTRCDFNFCIRNSPLQGFVWSVFKELLKKIDVERFTICFMNN